MFDMSEYENELTKVLQDDVSNVYFLCENRLEKPYVIVNKESKFNEKYVSEKQFPILKTNHNGGVGVIFPTDVGFTWVSDKSSLRDIVAEILIFLQKHKGAVWSHGNDIMFDQYKLFGTMGYKIDNRYYEGVFFSFNSDPEIIEKVCLKKQVKIPKGLSEIKIDRDELISVAIKAAENRGLKPVK